MEKKDITIGATEVQRTAVSNAVQQGGRPRRDGQVPRNMQPNRTEPQRNRLVRLIAGVEMVPSSGCHSDCLVLLLSADNIDARRGSLRSNSKHSGGVTLDHGQRDHYAELCIQYDS